ncbi:TraR/DksA family transcriptional regulator [Candidatus Uhrbacteria bacterium]|nr:TraR/DksA family transcriptional regulator [Candidatus Uhrbacteria bacterium]
MPYNVLGAPQRKGGQRVVILSPEFLEGRATHLLRKQENTSQRLAGELPEQHRTYKIERLLPAVRAALARIAAGTYGICIDCGAPIPEQRLLKSPEAPRCAPCQTEVE